MEANKLSAVSSLPGFCIFTTHIMVLVLPFQNLSLHQSIILTGLQQVIPFLQWPILLYHDGNDNIDSIARNLSGSHSMFLANVPTSPYRPDLSKPQSTIILSSNPSILNSTFRKWSLWNAHGKILVILDNTKNIQKWITQLWETTRAVDVVVMLPDSPTSFFTWFPYRKNECLNVKTITKLDPANLFPAKIVPPLHNCPLKATASILAPIVVDEDYGMEPRLFHALAEKVGLRAEYVNLPEGEYVWRLFDDAGEPANGMKQLWENEIDVLFSGMGPSRVTDFADFLPTHYIEHSVWFVPGPKLTSKRTSIYRAFSYPMWLLVLSSFLCLFATFVALASGSSKFLLLLNTLAINLSIPSQYVKKQRYLIFTAFAYLYSLHITTAYQSSLMVFLSDIPREKPIATLKDLEEADLKIMINAQRTEFSQQLAETPAYRKILRPDKVSYYHYLHLERLVEPGGRAMLGPYGSFSFLLTSNASYYYDEKGFPKILILKHAVSSTDVSFLMPKGHPLVPLFSKYISRLSAAGLPGQFIREQVTKPAPKFKRKIEPFGMAEIEGPFYFYIVLIFLSFLAWIAELLIYSFQRKFLY